MRRLVAIAGMLLISTRVDAQPDAAPDGGHPEAKRLFEQARELMDRGKHAEACELFGKSLELERAGGTLLNLGDCAARAGELEKALLFYDAAAGEFESSGKAARAKYARGLVAAMSAKLSIVVVRMADPSIPGMTVSIGDRFAAPARELTQRTDPGPVEVVVRAPGHRPFTKIVEAPVGAQVVVEVPALALLESADRPPPLGPLRRKRSRVILAAGIGGAGVVGLGISTIAALVARDTYRGAFEASSGGAAPCSENGGGRPLCTPAGARRIEDAGEMADLATAAAIGGGVLVAAGVVLYLTAPKERVTIAPMADASTVGVAFRAAF
ncbi:MAG: hypothetical protein ACTHU0_12960 [Kofleriaceae bacterium]